MFDGAPRLLLCASVSALRRACTGATALILALGFDDRRRGFSILGALEGSRRILGAFV